MRGLAAHTAGKGKHIGEAAPPRTSPRNSKKEHAPLAIFAKRVIMTHGVMAKHDMRGANAMEAQHNDDLPHYGLYIDGSWTDAADGATAAVNEPALGRPMAYAASGSAADVDRAVRAARV